MVLDPVRVEPHFLGLLTEPEEIATRPPAEDSEAKPHRLVALRDPGMHRVIHAQNVNHARTLRSPSGPPLYAYRPADPMRARAVTCASGPRRNSITTFHAWQRERRTDDGGDHQDFSFTD